MGDWGCVGVWEQNICYHAAALVIPFNLICNMTLFCKFNFDLLAQPPKCNQGSAPEGLCEYVVPKSALICY